VGLLIACVLFLRRVMETTEISVIRNEIDPSAGSDARLHEEPLAIPSGIEVYEIDGPYFFGIATRFEELMMQMGDRPRVRIIRMRRVPFIDSTGLHNLETLCRMSQRAGSTLVLSGANPGVRATLENAGICTRRERADGHGRFRSVYAACRVSYSFSVLPFSAFTASG